VDHSAAQHLGTRESTRGRVGKKSREIEKETQKKATDAHERSSTLKVLHAPASTHRAAALTAWDFSHPFFPFARFALPPSTCAR
jgi:hypothetical protein